MGHYLPTKLEQIIITGGIITLSLTPNAVASDIMQFNSPNVTNCESHKKSYSNEYKSQNGSFSIPIDYSNSEFTMPSSDYSSRVLQEHIIKNSNNNLWTVLMFPQSRLMLGPDRRFHEPDNGQIKFVKQYDDEAAQLTIRWSSIYDINAPKQGKSDCLESKCGYDFGSEIIIDGRIGMINRSVDESLGKKTNSARMLISSDSKRYDIVFLYTDKYINPHELIEIVKGMKFIK